MEQLLHILVTTGLVIICGLAGGLALIAVILASLRALLARLYPHDTRFHHSGWKDQD